MVSVAGFSRFLCTSFADSQQPEGNQREGFPNTQARTCVDTCLASPTFSLATNASAEARSTTPGWSAAGAPWASDESLDPHNAISPPWQGCSWPR